MSMWLWTLFDTLYLENEVFMELRSNKKKSLLGTGLAKKSQFTQKR